MVFHFPPISGGGVVVIVGLANTLAEMGHDVTVLTPDLDWEGEKYNPKLNESIKIVKVNSPSKSNLKIAARRCYPNMKKIGTKLCQEEKFDLILSIFHPFHLVPKAAVEVGKKFNIPVTIKIDDAFYEKSSGIKSLQRKIEKVYNSKTLRNATKILVANENMKKEVSQYYKVPLEKIEIIPNGIETGKFFSKSNVSKTIVFSGVMYYHRGIDMLLEALPKIVNKVPQVELLLLGIGPEMEKLQDIVNEKKLIKNVRFEGWVEREKIPEYLADSAIGIGPLRSTKVTQNALPIKVLEYIASSLPIIAIENTLPKEILENGKNGYFVKDSKELSEKIILLLTDDVLRRKLGNASKSMVDKFDWKYIVKQIVDKSTNT